MRSTINLRLILILLVRENSKLSAEIGFTQFGSVYELICIFEQSLCMIARLKRINRYLNFQAEAGKAKRAKRAGPAALLRTGGF